MTSRVPLVLGADGLSQQLQSGDALAGASALKNYAINPAIQWAQEYGSAAQTAVATARYPVDGTQYVAVSNTSVVTLQQVASTTPGGSPYRLRLTVTTAETGANTGSVHMIEQRLDGADIADLLLGTSGAKNIAIRFGFKGPAGTYGVQLRANAGARTYTTSFTISAGQANTDTLQTFIIPGDTTGAWTNTEGTLGLVVLIGLQGGTAVQTSVLNSWTATSAVDVPNTQSNTLATIGNVIEVFDWGIYAGSVVPDFMVPDAILERHRCQRYFQSYPLAGASTPTTMLSTSGASAASAGSVNEEFTLPVPMRATPTITFANVANTNCSTPTAIAAGTDKSKIRFNTAATAAGVVSSVFTWKADARP